MDEQLIAPLRMESISKCYRIYQNPQDRFKQALLDRFHVFSGRKEKPDVLYREHWALRDVSFELQPGEAVGILGRNGAGKSTLLQIIAGTLEPTAGRVHTSGRITALLELGSGFNPEFTGRENVLLNAQILGLTREEALNRFDGIASFADIGDFIDQPVKTYSSGMMMRLAFAVQTAVDPKILIVDEALSVGDLFFQSKCMARVKKLVNDGVTLLFVSHDISAVRQICHRAVLLEGGCISYIGEVANATDTYTRTYLSHYNEKARPIDSNADQSSPPSIISLRKIPDSQAIPIDDEGMLATYSFAGDEAYLSLLADRSTFRKKCDFERLENGTAKFLNVCLFGERGQTDTFSFGEKVSLIQIAKFETPLSNVNAAYKIRTLHGVDVVFGDSRMFGDLHRSYEANGIYAFIWQFNLSLGHGAYNITSGLAHPPNSTGGDWEFIDFVPISCEFRVLPREGGMIDGLTAWNADLCVRRLTESVENTVG